MCSNWKYRILNSFLVERWPDLAMLDHAARHGVLMDGDRRAGFSGQHQETQMAGIGPLYHALTRRRLLGAAGVGAIALSNVALAKPGWAKP
jgi:hypothetical protein